MSLWSACLPQLRSSIALPRAARSSGLRCDRSELATSEIRSAPRLIFVRSDFVNDDAHKPLQRPSKEGLRSHERNCREHCQTSRKEVAYESEKKLHSGKINSDPYAKRTTGRVAATPARQSGRASRASRTRRKGAFWFFGRFHMAVGAYSCHQLWSTISPRRWRNSPSASLNPSHCQGVAFVGF